MREALNIQQGLGPDGLPGVTFEENAERQGCEIEWYVREGGRPQLTRKYCGKTEGIGLYWGWCVNEHRTDAPRRVCEPCRKRLALPQHMARCPACLESELHAEVAQQLVPVEDLPEVPKAVQRRRAQRAPDTDDDSWFRSAGE